MKHPDLDSGKRGNSRIVELAWGAADWTDRDHGFCTAQCTKSVLVDGGMHLHLLACSAILQFFGVLAGRSCRY